MSEIEVTFTPTWQEARAAMRAMARRDPARGQRLWKPLLFVLAIALAVGIILSVYAEWIGRWITLPVFIGFLAGLYAMFGLMILRGRWQWRRVKARWQAHQNRLGPWRMRLGPEGYRVETDLSTVEATWEIVNDIFRMPAGTGLLVGTAIIVVPDAALPTDVTPDEVRAQLKAWRAA
ncbi:hypothetical protein [Vannielia litorea]|uniref:hypothetical protein n=1 Tax=Vannielia litorea TaxID=1217970 RepID=UPI001BCB01E8|nr:hypothetical protein [Vannielia litorea]